MSVILIFLLVEIFQLSTTLTVKSNIVCSFFCASNEKCRGHQFFENKAANNCELALEFKPYSQLLDPFWLIKQEKKQSSHAKPSLINVKKVPQEETLKKATAAGFNILLELTKEIMFLKHVTMNKTIDEAILECLALGGVLAMEDSDEFIEKMSTLVGDSTSTRFTSLVRELGHDPSKPHLVWQIGRVETTELGSSHSKYTSWDNRYFVVNPATKAYESVSNLVVKSDFYCQYVGENIGLNKAVYPSSIHWNHGNGSNIVDGILYNDIWHTDIWSPIQKHWFAIDLGGEFLVNYVLFLGRRGCCGERAHFMKVWVGNEIPTVGQSLDVTKYQLCGEYPYIHGSGYLSGIMCVNRIRAQVVILQNGFPPIGSENYFHLEELLIF